VSILKKSKKPKLDEPTKPAAKAKSVKASAKDKTTRVTRSSKPKDDEKAPLSISKLKSKASNGAKPSKKLAVKAPDEESEEEEDVVADQSAALLAGFESSSESGEEGQEEEGLALDKIPGAPITAAERKKLDAAAKEKKAEDEPGTVYVGYAQYGTIPLRRC
jgi:nucleolar protein 15